MQSTKANIAYSLLLTLGNYIFPLLTYPYVSRVLGVTTIGICNYVDSIVNYFVLFSTLGILSVGIREIARSQHNKQQLSIVFSSLLTIHFCFSLLGCVVLVAVTYCIDSLMVYKSYLLIGVVKIIFNSFLIEWFYEGLSNFKYITIRSLLIKALYVVAIFSFIHTEKDTFCYYAITSLFFVVCGATINCSYSKKLVVFSCKNIKIKSYLLPILSFGLYKVLTSMYTSFNVLYLGSTISDKEVGYFSTATKLYTIFMAVFSAYTSVMIPKVSKMIGNNENAQLRQIASKTINLVFFFSIPIIIVSLFYAKPFVLLIAGEGYEGAIIPFRIVMSLLLVIALEQIIITQFLMATRDSKEVLLLSLVGAFVGVSANIILVPRLASIGSACSWVLSECVVLLVAIWFFYKKIKVRVIQRQQAKYLLFCIPYFCFCLYFSTDAITPTLFYGLICCFVWFVLSYFIIVKKIKTSF